MTQTQQFDADVAAIEPEGQFVFVYDGRNYIAQQTPSADRMAMVDAGFEAVVDFMISVRASQFPDNILPPSNTETITIADVEYRIVTTSPDQYGVVITYGIKQNT